MLSVKSKFHLDEISNDHVNDLHDILSIKECSQFILGRPHQSLSDTVSYYNALESQITNRNKIVCGIFINSGKLIGFVIFHGIDRRKRTMKIGYVLHSEYQHKGIMTQSLLVILQYVFQYTDLVRIQASVNPVNEMSIKTLERCRFMREGRLRLSSLNPATNELEDRIVFSIIKSDISCTPIYACTPLSSNRVFETDL